MELAKEFNCLPANIEEQKLEWVLYMMTYMKAKRKREQLEEKRAKLRQNTNGYSK